MANELTDWVKGIPPVTRFLFFSILIINMLHPVVGFGNGVYLTWQGIRDFQLWRIYTAGVTTGGPGIMLLMLLFMTYQYTKLLETVDFARRRADFIFCVVFLWTVLAIACVLMNSYYFSPSLNLALIYVWAKNNSNQTVNFYFGARFKAALLPWAIVVMNVIQGMSPIPSLVGCAAGHLYYFLDTEAPVQFGLRLLDTPQIFHKYFDEPIPEPTEPVGRTTGGGYNWGRGNTLGDN